MNGEAGQELVTANQPGVKELSHKHMAILDYMLVNPQAPMGEVAKHFNLTPAWLSTLVNADLFQEELRKRRVAIEKVVEARINGQLEEIAQNGLDKMSQYVKAEDADPRVVADMTRTALANLGFGKAQPTPSAPATQNIQNNILVDKETFLQAQNLLRKVNGLPAT